MRKIIVIFSIIVFVGIILTVVQLLVEQDVINFSIWSHPQKNDVYEEIFTEERIKIVAVGRDSVQYYKKVDWAMDGKITLKMSKEYLKEDYRRVD